MGEDADNLFERHGLDPRLGPDAITARMRELIQEAPEAQREQLRADWEALTLHPRDRLQHALSAFPETRPTVGTPPPRGRKRAQTPRLQLGDVLMAPSVAAPLGAAEEHAAPDPLPPLADDPILEDA